MNFMTRSRGTSTGVKEERAQARVERGCPWRRLSFKLFKPRNNKHHTTHLASHLSWNLFLLRGKKEGRSKWGKTMSKLEYLSPEGLRLDGRRPGEMRKVRCKMGVLTRPDGSAFFQQGNTQVIASVFGPHEVLFANKEFL